MIFIGIPMMYLELAVGQFKSRGPIMSWVMVPLFKGKFIELNSNLKAIWLNFDYSYLSSININDAL